MGRRSLSSLYILDDFIVRSFAFLLYTPRFSGDEKCPPLCIYCHLLLKRSDSKSFLMPTNDATFSSPKRRYDAQLSFIRHTQAQTGLPIYTVAAESFFTCSSKTRLFNVYWRMVSTYGRG